MKKEMLWFFGAMAVVAVVALIVGLTAEEISTAKLVGMCGCILAGILVSALRDPFDDLVVPKFFVFACTGMAILVGWATMDLVAKFGINVLHGFGLVFPATLLLFVLAAGFCLGVYWRERPSSINVRQAVATCAVYVLPAVILVPVIIYL
ncbi:MAG: hypothetical protein WC654_07945 [Patescibacteria group bacterium]